MLGASSCGDPQLRAADCSHPRLVRRLCASLLAADGQGSQDGSANGTGLQRALEDTAHAVLLGFEVGSWAGDDPAALHGRRPRRRRRRPVALRCRFALPRSQPSICQWPQGDVPYVPPDERAAQAAAGMADAAQQLHAEGYPRLAADLEAGVERLRR